MAPVRILMGVVLIPMMLVVLGLGLVVRCQVKRLQRWPGVTVSQDLGWWRRSVTSLSKWETNVSSVGAGLSILGSFWAAERYGWGWVRPVAFVFIVVTTTAPALVHNWTIAGRVHSR